MRKNAASTHYTCVANGYILLQNSRREVSRPPCGSRTDLFDSIAERPRRSSNPAPTGHPAGSLPHTRTAEHADSPLESRSKVALQLGRDHP